MVGMKFALCWIFHILRALQCIDFTMLFHLPGLIEKLHGGKKTHAKEISW
jgi:hypothetical protein